MGVERLAQVKCDCQGSGLICRSQPVRDQACYFAITDPAALHQFAWRWSLQDQNPRLLARCRSKVIEWFVELQVGKPRTPSLSQLSFEKRQVQKRTEHTQHLSTLTTTSQIIAFGCGILKEDDSILQAFIGSVFQELCDFASEDVRSGLQQDRAALQFRSLVTAPEEPIDLDP